MDYYQKYLKYKQKYLQQKGGAGETVKLFSQFSNYTVPDPQNLSGAFLIPVWYNSGTYYGVFGIDQKNEINPLGGKPENNEKAIATAMREFFEETINANVPSYLLKTLGDISKKANHLKYVCGNQVYYLTNANIFADQNFHSVNGNTHNGYNLVSLNFSQFSNQNTFNAFQFINSRGEEKRQANNGLYEIKYLVAINLKDFRDYIKKNQNVKGLKYGNFVVRGDLKRCIINGLLDFIQ